MRVGIYGLAMVAIVVQCCTALTYDLRVTNMDPLPILSYVDGTSAFQQTYNPSYIVPSPGTKGVGGIVARSQNCTAAVGGSCVECSGPDQAARYIKCDFNCD